MKQRFTVVFFAVVLVLAILATFALSPAQSVDLPTCQYTHLPLIQNGDVPPGATSTIPPLPTADKDGNVIVNGVVVATATIPPPPLQCNTPTPAPSVTP